jgi:hypothetical protein
LNRLVLAFRAFWHVLTAPEFAARVAALFQKAPAGPDLRILSVLQRDGRLVDFLLEDLSAASDAEIGAGVRDIQNKCRKALLQYLTVEPIRAENEGAEVIVEPGFDAAAVRLTGNISGAPPFRGVLKHHGWRVKSVQLPALPGAQAETAVLAPAEVELP